MAEPVTLAEAKLQVRMENDNSEDTFITSLIAPARAYVEKSAGISFVGAQRTAQFSRWGDYLELWRRPVASIDSVQYGAEGTETDYAGVQANLSGYPIRIYPAANDAFPELADGETITVTYTTGTMASTSDEYLIGKRAILLLIGYWYDNRGEVPLDKDTEFAIDCILESLGPVSAY